MGYITREIDGVWYAISTTKPRFCFADETEAAVKAKVERCIAFYNSVKDRLPKPLSPGATQS